MGQFVIIGGTFKSGTSSLFTYLNQVEKIVGASVKETGFFVPARYGQEVDPIQNYYDYFNGSNNYYLEASPGYLYGGYKIAKSIKENLGPEVRLIFLFRNPTDRFISFYKMLVNGYIEEKNTDVVTVDTSLLEYFNKAKRYLQNGDLSEPNLNYVLSGLSDGCYAKYLREWYNVFEAKNIKICFFESLAACPKKMCKNVLEWLELDTECLDNINYRIVNKSRNHRSGFLKKVGVYINRSLENFFRNNEDIKSCLVKIYSALNIYDKPIDFDEKTVKKIDDFYRDHNRALAQLLNEVGYTEKPEWVV